MALQETDQRKAAKYLPITSNNIDEKQKKQNPKCFIDAKGHQPRTGHNRT